MCPCGIFLGSVPVPGQRSLAQESCFVNIRRLVGQNCHQRTVETVELDRFEQTHDPAFVNDGLNRLNHRKMILPVVLRASRKEEA